MNAISILWQRLDTRGHDACRLLRVDAGWRIEGTAVYCHEGAPAAVTYRVDFDSEWRTTSGRIVGWWRNESVDSAIVRERDGSWRMNGTPAAAVEGCVDLDFGFTPATNLSQLRRLDLRIGETRTLGVAWVDLPARRLERLDQSYTRRSASSYGYESPRFGYAELLELREDGFIREYPKLWRAAAP